MLKSIVKSSAGLIMAAFASASLTQPAYAQTMRSQVVGQMNQLINQNPGSALVFGGCSAAAASEYDKRGDMRDALGVLTSCAAMGCMLTNSYSNCLKVNTQLFALYLLRR